MFSSGQFCRIVDANAPISLFCIHLNFSTNSPPSQYIWPFSSTPWILRCPRSLGETIQMLKDTNTTLWWPSKNNWKGCFKLQNTIPAKPISAANLKWHLCSSTPRHSVMTVIANNLITMASSSETQCVRLDQMIRSILCLLQIIV